LGRGEWGRRKAAKNPGSIHPRSVDSKKEREPARTIGIGDLNVGTYSGEAQKLDGKKNSACRATGKRNHALLRRNIFQ